ncbi:TonB-dependent receptor [Archangium violaceum]|uniref:TonB-dependent receptor n=1 Tax=Archangium violaceum TaxID=83451 RepID=UPI00193C6AE2|nr:TonB-dependent receptor [Archangium violaceum]QRK08902.1 TonB-dependent receptor [Archangium violaceum]
MQVRRMLRATGVVVVASLSYGTAAYADSVIVGTVVSAENKKPVADVVVTATSPNLLGEQVVVTDAQGQYRIPQLPPGVYTLRFDKESFKPFSRPDIQLRLDRTIRVNVELLPESFTELIEVTARPPTIDVGSTNTGVSVDQDFIKRIAVNRPSGRGGASRSFESLAELAPGAQSDQYGVSINGATSPENGYVVDGLSTNDAAFGINASPLSVEFVQDVNIITGGYMPEYGRSTGGVVNAVTKSGSNEFHGTVFANWTPGSLEGTRTAISSSGSVITGQSSLANLGDLGATLGGPIIKDKLWFFAGVAPSATRWKHLRTLNAYTEFDADGNPTATRLIPGSERTFFADQRSVQAMGKLTYLINQDHNLSLSVNTSPTTSGGNGRLTINRLTGGVISRIDASPDATGLSEVNTNSTAVGLKYAGSFMEKKLLLDANVGVFHQTASTLPIDGSGDLLGTPEGDKEILSGNGLAGLSRVTYVYPRSLVGLESLPGIATTAEYCGTTPEEQLARCPVQAYDIGGFGGMSKTLIDRYQANVKATYLANFFGQHVIKAGADTEMLVYDQTKAISGGVSFQEVELSNGEIGWSDFRRYGYQTGPDSPVNLASLHTTNSSITVGGFVQDSWSIANRVTINAGLRYDVQSLYGGDQLAFVLGNQWSPRVGVIVDPLGNGQMKVYANYARYYEQVPLNLVDRQFPGESRYNTYRVAASADAEGCDPSTLAGQRGNCADPDYIFESAESSRNPSRLYTGGKLENLSVDPDISAQSSTEYLVGAEYELLANTRLTATYTHRAMNSVIEDMSRDDGATYFLGNPGSGFAKEFPTPERTYNAVTVALTRAFGEGWLAQASYTWSRLYGNYPGLFRPETGQLDPNILSDFDLISLLDNRTGLLPYDRTHSVKVFGAKEFNFTKDFSGSLGLSYRGNSGTPINYLGGHVDYGEGEGFVLPRGSAGRTPWVNNIDTNIGLNYRVTKTSTVSFTLDVFNIFNFQTETLVDENYTYAAVLPVKDGTPADLPNKVVVVGSNGDQRAMTADDVNPNFKKPTQYQSPRQVRFGVRYTF